MDEWAEYDSLRLLARLTGGRGSISAASRSIAFMQSLPPLTSRAMAKAFIACLAVGLQEGILKSEQTKTLMYTAQLALAAHRGRTRKA